jgi:hypothetical protein
MACGVKGSFVTHSNAADTDPHLRIVLRALFGCATSVVGSSACSRSITTRGMRLHAVCRPRVRGCRDLPGLTRTTLPRVSPGRPHDGLSNPNPKAWWSWVGAAGDRASAHVHSASAGARKWDLCVGQFCRSAGQRERLVAWSLLAANGVSEVPRPAGTIPRALDYECHGPAAWDGRNRPPSDDAYGAWDSGTIVFPLVRSE